MADKYNILEKMAQTKVIPVIKIDDAQKTSRLLDAVCEGGIDIAEITFRTSCAAQAISAASKHEGVTAGAGTVINADMALRAIECGAKFIVSPGFDKAIADLCHKQGVLYLGGCVTPTEIMKALSNGIDTVKYFPAQNYGGVNGIKALSAPFPQIKFVPTGGINISNIKEYLAFDKVIACGGSWMVSPELIENSQFEKITSLCAQAVNTAKEVKK